MALNSTIQRVTDRIIARSEGPRKSYLDRMAAAAADGGVFNYDATLRKVLPLQLSAAQRRTRALHAEHGQADSGLR